MLQSGCAWPGITVVPDGC